MAADRWCPKVCPITGREFFCWIESEDGSIVPTYGGPFDSYTLPEQDVEGGTFTVRHYDHDRGGWRDHMDLGVMLIDDQHEHYEYGTVEALQAAIDALRAEAGAVGWMPIESAPKDGTEVLCWDKSEALVPLVMHYSSADYFEKEYGDRDYMVEGWYLSYSYPDGMHEETCSPTHWQPLSPRPSQKD